jgi:hypothetical protein
LKYSTYLCRRKLVDGKKRETRKVH